MIVFLIAIFATFAIYLFINTSCHIRKENGCDTEFHYLIRIMNRNKRIVLDFSYEDKDVTVIKSSGYNKIPGDIQTILEDYSHISTDVVKKFNYCKTIKILDGLLIHQRKSAQDTLENYEVTIYRYENGEYRDKKIRTATFSNVNNFQEISDDFDKIMKIFFKQPELDNFFNN